MKQQIKNIFGITLACTGLLMNTSCLDYEEINKNPYYPDKEMEQYRFDQCISNQRQSCW